MVLDRAKGETNLISTASGGSTPSDGRCFAPLITPNGRTVVFTTFASNFVERDYNQQSDIFWVRLPGVESDFRVTGVYRATTHEVTLFWPATEGAVFRVEYSDSLPGHWKTLDVPILNGVDQATAVDRAVSSPAARFYRVVQTSP